MGYVPPVDHSPAKRTAATVRAELARRRISGREMARHLGWSPATTQRRLAGTAPLDIDELAAVAAFLGVPIVRLLPDENTEDAA